MKNFFLKLINSKSNESSKRFIVLWLTMLLTFVVIYGVVKTPSIIFSMVTSLMAGILAMAGVTVYESIKNNNKDKEDEV